MAEPAEFSRIAKEFIDRANDGTGPTGSWRLEILQKRLAADRDGKPKKDADGNPKEIPVRIRRFLKGIPWAHVHDAIRYLISKSPYEGIVYNGVEIDGTYRPTLTQWRRDDQETVGGNAQGTYTLVQDLIETTGDLDSVGVDSAESCSETEHTEWVWDAPEVSELQPDPRVQGVTRAIRQVRRNDDGTFDYALVTQVARTHVTPRHVAECDEYSTTYVQAFDNVYGGIDGSPYVQDDGQTPVDVPAPCASDDGTTVTVQVTQNPDCTFRIVVQEKVAKTQVQTTESSKSIRGSRTVTVTRNAESPVPESGLGIGDSVKNELQPDGRYTTTVERASEESVGDVGSTCQTTVFQHEHADVENVTERPETEAHAAGGGKTYEVSSRATDEGTWDVTRRTVEEVGVPSARKVRQKTLRGVTESVTDRNVTSDDVTVVRVGDRVEVEMTPGGRYNRTVTSVDRNAEDIDLGDQCSKTVFEHQTRKDTVVPDKPADVHAEDAGDGITRQRVLRQTEGGAWEVSDTSTEEIEVPSARKVRQKTLRGVTESVTDRNVASDDVTVVRVGDRVEVEMTPGGRYNRTVTSVTSEPVGTIARSGASTVFSRTTETLDNVLDVTEDDWTGSSVCGGGPVTTRSVRATDEGSWDRVVKTEDPVSRSWTDPDVSTNYLFSRTYRFRNFTKGQVDELSEDVGKFVDWKLCSLREASRPPASHSVDTSSNLNDFGLFDGNVSVRIAWDVTSSGQFGEVAAGSAGDGVITDRFLWKTFSTQSKYYGSYSGPTAGTYHVSGMFYTLVYTHIRLSGYGRAVLDGLLHSGDDYYVVNAVQFDYDEKTGRWRYEAVIDTEEPSTMAMVGGFQSAAQYPRDISYNYGLPTPRKLFRTETELSDSVRSFLDRYVVPYEVPDSRRMGNPGGVSREPVPSALYPDTCGR